MLQGRFPMHLPESLKPRPGHLNPAQQRVYEDFARIPRGAAGAHAAVGGGKPLASMDKVCLFEYTMLPCTLLSIVCCLVWVLSHNNWLTLAWTNGPS